MYYYSYVFDKPKSLTKYQSSPYRLRWKHLLFKEESEKWQENGGDDMLVDHNDEGANATGGNWFYQNHEYCKEDFVQGEEQVWLA